MIAVSLALAAAIAWGLADYMGGIQTRRLSGVLVVLVSQACALVLLLTVVGVVQPALALPARATAWAAVAGCAEALGLAALYQGLGLGAMSLVAPIAATGVLLPVVVGAAGGDRPSTLQVIGMAAAVTGTLLACRQVREQRAASASLPQGLALALAAAFAFGIGLTAIQRAAAADVVGTVVVARATSVLLLALAIATLRLPIAGVGRSLAPVATVGVLDLAATLLFALATTKGLLSIVSVTAGLAPIVTVILAWVLLEERLRPTQALAVSLAMVGVVCIGAG